MTPLEKRCWKNAAMRAQWAIDHQTMYTQDNPYKRCPACAEKKPICRGCEVREACDDYNNFNKYLLDYKQGCWIKARVLQAYCLEKYYGIR